MMKWLPWLKNLRQDAQTSTRQNSFLWREQDRSTNIPYLLPRTHAEINRLDFQHYLIRYIMQCLYVAPIQEARSILDVGCGTGRWAYEMAALFPQAKIFGVDIYPQEDTSYQAPHNYRYIYGNVLEELPFPDETFDFVHQRFLHVAIPSKQWPHVINQLARITRKGGWIELAESDIIIQSAGPAMKQLIEWGFHALNERGIHPQICTQLGMLLQQTGMEHVQQYRIDIPLGQWGGRAGALAAKDMIAYNQSIKPAIIQGMGIDPRQYDSLSQMMQKEWEEHRSFFSVYITCGQRPTN